MLSFTSSSVTLRAGLALVSMPHAKSHVRHFSKKTRVVCFFLQIHFSLDGGDFEMSVVEMFNSSVCLVVEDDGNRKANARFSSSSCVNLSIRLGNFMAAANAIRNSTCKICQVSNHYLT